MHAPTQSVLENTEQRGRLQEDRATGDVRVACLVTYGKTEWVRDKNRLSEFVVPPGVDPWYRYKADNAWKKSM
jgi:hypothetical protein